MSQTKEADAVIGEDCFLKLHRLLERIAVFIRHDFHYDDVAV